MTAPTFTSITPAAGIPGGQYVCKVVGTDFKLPPAPAATGYVGGTWTPSMEIEVNGREAEDIRVYSSSLLTFIMPAFRGDPNDIGIGLDVDLVLRNLDPDEPTTATDAFQYKRQNIARGDGALAHIVRTMILDLRRQIINNVAPSTEIEYDADSGAAIRKVTIASTPAIAVFGPGIRENLIYRTPRRAPVQDVGTLTYNRFREPHIVDLLFDFTIFTANDGAERDLLNLQQLMILFFRDNTHLTVDQQPDDLSAGTVELQLWLTAEPSVDQIANTANLHSASGSFEIRAVPLDHDEWLGIEQGYMTDDPADVDIDYEPL